MKKVADGTATALLSGKSTSEAEGSPTKPATKAAKSPKTPKASVAKGKVKDESTEDNAATDPDELTTKIPKTPKTPKTPKAPVTKGKVKDESNTDNAATGPNELATTPTHDNVEDDVNATPMTPATPSSSKKRSAKTAEADEDAATETPTKKRTRKPPTPKIDEHGIPVARAKPGRKPKADEDGKSTTTRVRKPTKAQLEKQAAAEKAAEDEQEAEEEKAKEAGVLNFVDVLFEQGKAQATNSFTPVNPSPAVNEEVKVEGDESGEEGEVKEEVDASEVMRSDPVDEAGQEV